MEKRHSRLKLLQEKSSGALANSQNKLVKLKAETLSFHTFTPGLLGIETDGEDTEALLNLQGSYAVLIAGYTFGENAVGFLLSWLCSPSFFLNAHVVLSRLKLDQI